jgi:hypothetical protein
LADGTYTAGCKCAGSPIGAIAAGQLIFQGHPGRPDLVIIDCVGDDCFVAEAGASIWIKDMTLQSVATATGGNAVAAAYSGVLAISNVIFGPTTYNHMYAVAGGQILVWDNYSISGGANYHVEASAGGYCEMSSAGRHITVSLLGSPPHFVGGFIVCSFAYLVANNNTWSGNATGIKHLAQYNGVIDTETQGINYFPGDVAGNPSVVNTPNSTGGIFIGL